MLSLVLVIVTPLISNLAFEDARYSSISFDTNGGSSISPRDIKVGDRIEIPETTKEGFTFVDWYKDDSFVKPFNLTIMPARDFKIYAKWDADLYTIHFETNGGNSITSIQGYFGDSIALPNNPTREGHTFQGWYRDSNYNNYFNLSAFPSMNMTLYAKWLVNQYTITFNTNGGDSIQSQTKNYNASLSIPTPAQVGHSFAGWFTDVGLTQTFTLTNMPAQNFTLYAKWTINQYTITFNTNGGSSVSTITGNYGDSFSSPNDPTKEGYTFNGWYANASLTQITIIPTAIPAQNLTLYAKWTINQYTITFYTNGGNTIQTQENNYNATLSIPTLTKVGHSFAGWFADVGLTQTFTLTNMPAQNLTLYAKWTINQSTITFNTNGGSAIASITGNYGDPLTPPADPTREGHNFEGWYEDRNLDYRFFFPIYFNDNSIELFAMWSPLSPQVNFDSNRLNWHQSYPRNASATILSANILSYYGKNYININYALEGSYYVGSYLVCLTCYQLKFPEQEFQNTGNRIEIEFYVNYSGQTYNYTSARFEALNAYYYVKFNAPTYGPRLTCYSQGVCSYVSRWGC